MKAFVYERYGPPEVLEPREVPRPTPGDGEILIRVRATTVTSGDWRMRSLDVPPGFRLISRLMFGVLGPRKKVLGVEVAGEIAEVGEKVTGLSVGDEVFAIDDSDMGGYAEYKCMRADGCVAMRPPNLDLGEAAALSFGGTTALHFLRAGRLEPGERVLVNGASGGVGTAAVQVARKLGAEVTAVCGPAAAEMVRSLGAERVIDYTREDFASGGATYDVVLDPVGTARFPRSKRVLARGGRLLQVMARMSDMLLAPWRSLVSGRKVVAGVAVAKPEHLRLLAEWAEAGDYRPVIDRRYALEDLVEAHRYVDTGHKKGNVVVTLDGGD
jgi:NADPH:quinone reductase-like Zn-dependent oxidoreductase